MLSQAAPVPQPPTQDRRTSHLSVDTFHRVRRLCRQRAKVSNKSLVVCLSGCVLVGVVRVVVDIAVVAAAETAAATGVCANVADTGKGKVPANH
jgi:hypothetical protein